MRLKKLICFMLSMSCMFMISRASAVYTDVSKDAEYSEAAVRLSDLKILSGYEDATFRPFEPVTRAQIAKMIVCIMDKEDAARSRGFSSRFPDVADGHWAVPYINYATQNGILKGYVDGTYGPDRQVTYAELSAIMLRMLKYTETDLGYEWPHNFTEKANSLGWNQGAYVENNAVLTRALTVMIIDDALFSDLNSSAEGVQKNQTLLSLYGKEILEDALLMAQPSDDTTLSRNEVSILFEDEGSNRSDVYKTDVEFEGVFRTGEVLSHIVIDPDTDRIVAARRYEDGEKGSKQALFATINRVVGDRVEYIAENGTKGTVTLTSDFVTYVDFSKSTYASTKSKFVSGTDITLYGEYYGDWDFVVINAANSTEPVLATRNYTDSDNTMEGIKINHQNLTVYRNGKTAVLSDINKGDVVYYNTKTNIMDVYTKKVTGIYYEAKPTKAYVTTVTVGGKDYQIGTISAANKLDATPGAYDIGDRVTLLLGKNDEVVFVSEVSGFNSMDYGVVLNTSTRLKESGTDSGKSEFVANLFMPDGETYEYVTDKNYKDYIGKLIKISDKGGAVALSGVNETKNFSGAIDKSSRTIAGKAVHDDLVIIQRVNNSDGNFSYAEILNFNTLNVSKISNVQVRNVISANDFGEIGLLYVEDLTDSAYTYGVLVSKKIAGEQISYSIYTDGALSTYSSTYNSTATSGPVMFKLDGSKIGTISGLHLYDAASKYEAIDETRVKINSKVYDIDTDVKIFKKENTGSYSEKSFEDLKNANTTNVSVYSNVLKSSNGIIKVIVYTEK